MTNRSQVVELEIRRKSQELAVAWRKGKAAFVLESLTAEEPLRAALIATLIHEALARWDPYDSKWPNGFRQALLTRSQGLITSDEIAELERAYCRQFGSSPPQMESHRSTDEVQAGRRRVLHAQRIQDALSSGQPLVRVRPSASPMFLRPQPARR